MQKENPFNLILVEDDVDTAAIVQAYLEHANLSVNVFHTGNEGLDGIFNLKPHLAIIDWMLPQKSGIDILKQLRESEVTKKLPVILLTAKGEEETLKKVLLKLKVMHFLQNFRVLLKIKAMKHDSLKQVNF